MRGRPPSIAAITVKPTADTATHGMSMAAKRASDGIGWIRAVIPRTPKILKMLEPTMLPTAISVCLRMAAMMLVAISGRLVLARDERHHQKHHRSKQQQDAVQPPHQAIHQHHPDGGCRQQHEGKVAPYPARGNKQRRGQRRNPKDQQDIGDLGTKDVANRSCGLALKRRLQRDRQLGCRRADANDRQADHHRCQADVAGATRALLNG